MSDITEQGRRWHDMGGREAGPVERAGEHSGHDHALWEKRVDALMRIASARGLMTVDGLRRALEDMGEEAFESRSYYERWIGAITQNLLEAGAFTVEELNARMEAIAARGASYGEAQGENQAENQAESRGGGA